MVNLPARTGIQAPLIPAPPHIGRGFFIPPGNCILFFGTKYAMLGLWTPPPRSPIPVPRHAFPPLPSGTPSAVRGIIVPGASLHPLSVGMAASGFLRSALRCSGVRAVRLRPASACPAAPAERARAGRTGFTVRLLSASGAVVRFHGPLPAACGLYGPQCRL